MSEIKRIALSKIRLDGGTQSRAELNGETIAEYAERVDVLPAAVVFFDGAVYWMADGFHRWHGHDRAGKKTMPCEVHQGTVRDAILYSVGANDTHGIRRTNADKRRAVETLLRDDEWCGWSDREIARRAGVSHPFVMQLRAQLVTVTSSAPRIGADGKTRKPPKAKSAVTSDDVERAREALEEIDAKRGGKWECPECSTWWSGDKTDCAQCALEEREPKSRPRASRRPFNALVALDPLLVAFDAVVEGWPEDESFQPLVDLLRNQTKSAARLQETRRAS